MRGETVIEDFDTTEPRDATEDPAGGVQLPASRREIARAYALAGVTVGFGAIIGITGWTTPGTSTSITA
jgi:hypothetical protein